MKVTVSELISNQEVAVILDDWHLNGGYELHLLHGHLYRLDLQQLENGMECVTISDLVRDWMNTLDNRQSMHDDSDEVKAKERQELDVLQAYLTELENGK